MADMVNKLLREKERELYEVLDKDGDGFIDMNEFNRCLDSLSTK